MTLHSKVLIQHIHKEKALGLNSIHKLNGMASSSSTVVEQSTHDHEFKGSDLTYTFRAEVGFPIPFVSQIAWPAAVVQWLKN
jgi:hypothetical protein